MGKTIVVCVNDTITIRGVDRTCPEYPFSMDARDSFTLHNFTYMDIELLATTDWDFDINWNITAQVIDLTYLEQQYQELKSMIDETRHEPFKIMNTFNLGRLLTMHWTWPHWLEKLLALGWTVLGALLLTSIILALKWIIARCSSLRSKLPRHSPVLPQPIAGYEANFFKAEDRH